MPFGTATVTFDLKKLLGNDIDARRTKVWLTTNVDRDIVNDETSDFRIALDQVTVESSGAVTFTVPTPSGTTNPTSWQTRVHIDAATIYSERIKRTLGPFTITADALLSDLVDEQEVPPTYLTTLTQEFDEHADAKKAEVTAAGAGALVARDESVAAADRSEQAAADAEALVISDLGTTDGQTRALIEATGSQTYAALSAQTATRILAELATGGTIDEAINTVAQQLVDEGLATGVPTAVAASLADDPTIRDALVVAIGDIEASVLGLARGTEVADGITGTLLAADDGTPSRVGFGVDGEIHDETIASAHVKGVPLAQQTGLGGGLRLVNDDGEHLGIGFDPDGGFDATTKWALVNRLGYYRGPDRPFVWPGHAVTWDRTDENGDIIETLRGVAS